MVEWEVEADPEGFFTEVVEVEAAAATVEVLLGIPGVALTLTLPVDGEGLVAGVVLLGVDANDICVQFVFFFIRGNL